LKARKQPPSSSISQLELRGSCPGTPEPNANCYCHSMATQRASPSCFIWCSKQPVASTPSKDSKTPETRLNLLEDATVIDLGAGTGQFTLAVAPHCARVVAVDVSEVMLTLLRDEVATASATNITVVQAGFLTYQHPNEPADLVHSRYALHHLPDTWKAIALTRMRRMLRTGGLLRLWDVVYDCGLDEVEARLEAWCATGGDGIVGEWSRAELEEHVRDEHSTFTWLLEPMIGAPVSPWRRRCTQPTVSLPATCSEPLDLDSPERCADTGGPQRRLQRRL